MIPLCIYIYIYICMYVCVYICDFLHRHFTSHEPWKFCGFFGEIPARRPGAGLGCEGFLLQKLIPDTMGLRKPPVGKEG